MCRAQDLIPHFEWRQLDSKSASKSPIAKETSSKMCTILVNIFPIKGPAPVAIGMTQNSWDLHLKGQYIPITWFNIFHLQVYLKKFLGCSASFAMWLVILVKVWAHKVYITYFYKLHYIYIYTYTILFCYIGTKKGLCMREVNKDPNTMPKLTIDYWY